LGRRTSTKVACNGLLRTQAPMPSELRRYQRLRSRVITANIETGAPISAASVVAWARERDRDLGARFPGAHLIFGGEFEDTQRSFESLTRAFFVAVLLIYLILAVQFRSYSQPALILSTVMFAIIGVVFGKLLSLGLLPMALGLPSYSVVWGSMASTFVAGLATATILTIFVVPVGWDLLVEWQEKRRRATGPTSTAEHAG
jgi:multidrug efflux pump subunit AcrB